MSRRGENIYKRKDGRWEGRLLNTDGSYRYVYAKSYREVKEKKKTLEARGKSGANGRASEDFGACRLFESWLKDRACGRVKPSTYENYFCCTKKYIIPYFRRAGTKYITESDARLFSRAVCEDNSISGSYRRKIITVFKTALREMLRDSANYAAVLGAVAFPRPKNAPVQVFSVGEQRLIEHEVLKSKDKRALGILLCFYSGIRLGELCALRWKNIDFEAGTISVAETVNRIMNFEAGGKKTMLYVGTPKSASSVRTIPLPDFILKLADSLKPRAKNEEAFILTNSGVPIDPRTYQRLFKRILEGAGVRSRKFHAIRHSFATRALEMGVDIKTLSEILGHSNATITLNVYAHSFMEQKKIAIEKLNRLHLTHMTHIEVVPFAVGNAVSPS